MSELVTSFRQSFLEGKSYSIDDPAALAAGRYDVMILASSWDSRCLCVTSGSDLHAGLGHVLLFDVRDEQGLRDSHDPKVIDFAKRHSERTETSTIPSTKIDHWWPGNLLGHLRAERERVGRPLTVFIDSSACPRFLTLALLASCITHGIAQSVSVFYAEGVYPPPEENRKREIAFTEGRWRTIAVPFLQGTFDPRKKRFYLVSVGFEGWKTLRVVSLADPDRVSVLFPDPAVEPEYVTRTQDDNTELIAEYLVPDEHVIRARAGDAVEAWRRLAEAAPDRPLSENSYYLCCGTKPHSLALGLRALALGYPAVLYNVPDKHAVVNIQAAGTFWRYDIRDVTAS
jgi:hypothetical protein